MDGTGAGGLLVLCDPDQTVNHHRATMAVTAPAVPQRKLSSILVADVHGYSRLVDRDEEGTYRRVMRTIGLIRA